MKRIITNIIKSIVRSSPNVSQVCIGNGNVQCRGNIVGGKVVINNREINLENENWIGDEYSKGNIKIEIVSDVHKVDIPIGDVTVKGNVTGSVNTSQGDITIEGDADGDVSTSMGDIIIKGKHSGGNVSTMMGDVNICG
jgi:archaellum component FlaF (FlaF/FlaG flagellin family)